MFDRDNINQLTSIADSLLERIVWIIMLCQHNKNHGIARAVDDASAVSDTYKRRFAKNGGSR